MHGIVLEQVRERVGVGEVIDGDDVEVAELPLKYRPENEPADASKSVDRELDGHGIAFYRCEFSCVRCRQGKV